MVGVRPLGVIVIVVLVLLLGIQSIAAGLGFVAARQGSIASVITDETLFEAYEITMGLILIAAALATFFLWRVGWYATILLAGFGLAVQITLYFWGTPNFVSLALFVVTALYLNQRQVKALFLAPRNEPTTVVLTTADDRAP